MTRQRFVGLLRLLVAGLLGFAGLSKLGDPESFALALSHYRLLPRQALQPLAYLLPPLEIVTAVALLVSVWRRAGWWIAAALFTTFAGAVASAVLRGLDVSCGCFGAGTTVSWYHTAGNLLLAGLCLAQARQGLETSARPATLQAIPFLLALSAFLGCLHHAVAADRPLFAAPRNPAYERLELLSLQQTRAAWSRPGAIFIDVRPREAYLKATLPRAVSLPLHTAMDETTLALLTSASEVVLFCSSRLCNASKEAAVALQERGLLSVKVFPGGLQEWKEAGYETAPGGVRLPSESDG